MIELLVVIVLIGVMLGVAVINLNPNSRDKRLEREATTLFQLLQLMSEEAVLQNREYGIRFFPHGYAFYTLDGKNWIDIKADNRLRERKLEDGFEPALQIDNVDVILEELVEKPKPQVMFLSSGEIIPDFRLLLRDTDTDRVYQLQPGEEVDLELTQLKDAL